MGRFQSGITRTALLTAGAITAYKKAQEEELKNKGLKLPKQDKENSKSNKPIKNIGFNLPNENDENKYNALGGYLPTQYGKIDPLTSISPLATPSDIAKYKAKIALDEARKGKTRKGIALNIKKAKRQLKKGDK